MENKKFITVLVFILLLIIILPIIYYVGSAEGREIVAKFDEAYNNSEKYTFIEIGYDDCYWCQQQQPILDELSSEYGLEYLFIDTQVVTSSQLEYIKEKVNATSNFGTPTMAIIGKGDVQETISGKTDEVALAEKLEKYDIIENYGFTELKEISYDEYYKLLKSKKPVVILIQRDGCSYCEKAIPQLKRTSYLTGVTIYSLNAYDAYIGAGYPDSASDEQKAIAKKLIATVPAFDEDGFFTPLLAIAKNGKIIASYDEGYAEESVYTDFLKENNIAK